MRLTLEPYADVERIIEFDFLRATEAAALNTLQWIGRGEKEQADAAACDAIRGMFDLINICGEVVIGEGIKDNAPGIFKGEHLGTWLPGSHKFDLALDPIDGTTNVAKGLPGSICCIAAASPEPGVAAALRDIPTFYMMKLSYGPRVVRYLQRTGIQTISILNPIDEVIPIISKSLRKRVQDLSITVLDRPRHAKLIETIRGTGASLRMISDGDITAAIAPSIPDSGVDLYVGIGGAPEAVLAAAAIRCLGGELQTMMWPRDEKEQRSAIERGSREDLSRVFTAAELAQGDNIIFCATGVSDSPLLNGVRVKSRTAVTQSILMRARSRTVRLIQAFHDLNHKTIRLRSTKRETPL
ncbi:MAG: class II fructose-bisphosphatase [Verrucomicrobia bacterium]|nr:class II fructose-bisphosphatase [Verrucomicrobiota bacterium]